MELLDVDRLFSDASDKAKAKDYELLRRTAGHLQHAAEHWDTTQIACDTVASVVSGTAEARLLREDVNIFRTLASGARELAAEMEKGILPPNTPVHKLTGLMRDQDVMAERRARAYQGLPGQLAEDYL